MKISDYYKWFKKDWAKAGLIVSFYLFVMLFVFIRKMDMIVFVLLLQTPLYMLHETEEYVFPGGFGNFFNTEIFKIKSKNGPLDQDFIFFVNISLVWIILPIFGILSSVDYRYGLWLPYFTFFAGIAHLLLAIRAKKLYNPGLVVSLIINIPVGLWSIFFLINKGVLSSLFLNPHMAVGLGVNALLPILGVLLLRSYKKEGTVEK